MSVGRDRRLLSSGVETSRTISQTFRDSSTSLGMTGRGGSPEPPGRLRSIAPAKQFCLRTGGHFQSELAIGVCGGNAALRRAFDVAFHDQIGLIDFLECAGFFADRYCQRSEPNRPTVEFMD